MPVVSPEKLVALQQSAEGIRNICILAHVDHGKTSLTDALIATNGIISPKLAGKIRYLDSRPDEQIRGITMESSAISLYFSLMRRPSPESAPVQHEHLINLIDSPGHIDFSSEVSTASRLCDGAVVLVDAVEGVCSQTVTVLRQTWTEKLRPLLVINKMDRLVTELRMTPGEAYTHLSKLLEQVNAVMGSFFQGERMEDDLKWRERMDERVSAKAQERSGDTNPDSITEDGASTVDYEEKDDEDIYFAPEKNNVIFSSAIDGWAFTVKQFAGLYEKKLGIKRSVLEKVLWGDFYLDPKTKRVLGSKHLKGRALKPMFVQLVLENIWAVYEATTGGSKGKGDPAMVEKITKALSINIPQHVQRSRDPKTLMSTLFAQWIPLSTALLVSVIEHLPSPPIAQAARLPSMIDSTPGGESVDPAIRDAMVQFTSEKGAPVVAYVSKMVSIPESELPTTKRRQGTALTAEEARELGRQKRAEIARQRALEDGGVTDVASIANSLSEAAIGEDEDEATNGEDDKPNPEHLIGFARLYSGTLSVGDTIYTIPPKYTPLRPDAHPQPQETTVTALYLLMGRSLESLNSVPAGAVFGIAGLSGKLLKSGTLCSTPTGAVNLAGIRGYGVSSAPIVRVALEPAWPGDLDRMIEGIKLLVQSDTCAEYEVLESGEHVISTAGELHLERCLKDLRERFAKCEIQAGEPIVPYRESIVAAQEMNPPRDADLPRGTAMANTTSGVVQLRLRVRPLPPSVTDFLAKHEGAIRRLNALKKAEEADTSEAQKSGADEGQAAAEEGFESGTVDTGRIMTISEFNEGLSQAFAEAKTEKEVWANVIANIASFGPRRVGPNLLIDMTGVATCSRALQDTSASNGTTSEENADVLTPRDFGDQIAYAFQLATGQGPLCNEPMQGVAVFLESITVNSPANARENLGRLTGEVLGTVRAGIRAGFLDWSPRMLLAMYSCEIQASTEVLGRVYAVLTRRRGRILDESMKEGTPFFTIVSLLPVAESFGFADEIRKRTSGAASPQLVFQGFEMLDEDPFWVPFTEEDLEDLGELADRENVAKRYMERVRKRKGLQIEGQVLVVNAEKQKTLKK